MDKMLDLEVGTLLYDQYNIEHEIRAVVDKTADVTVYAVNYLSPKRENQMSYEIVYSFSIEMGLYTLEPRKNPVKWG